MFYLSCFFLIALWAALPFLLVRKKNASIFFYSNYAVHGFMRFIIAAGHSATWWTLPDSQADSMRFFREATELAEQGTLLDQWYSIYLYENILSLIFRLSGPSYFIGSLTSIIGFSLFFIVVYRLIEKISSQYKPEFLKIGLYSFTLYCLLPSVLTYTTLIFREPWMMLFYALSVYGVYHVSFEQKMRGMMPYFFGFLGGMFLHKGLILYALKTPYLFLIPRSLRHEGWKAPITKHLILFAVALSLVWGTPFLLSKAHEGIKFSYMQTALEKGVFDDGGLAEHAERYQKRQVVSRTHYGNVFMTNSLENIVLTGIPQTFSYMFRPLPHEVNNIYDAYASLEGIIRLVLVLTTAIGWFYMATNERLLILSLTIQYSVLSLLWAAGTSSWGTAIRHHTSNHWLLWLTGLWGTYTIFRHYKPAETK